MSAEPGRDPLRALRPAAERAVSGGAGLDEVLAALALVTASREELDRIEQLLIEAARDGGASWARVSGALGLGSRQAAEQRWLRLRAQRLAPGAAGPPAVEGGRRDPAPARAARVSQQSIDKLYGERVGEIRAAAAAVHRIMATDPEWDGLHPRAALARRSVDASLDAPPGGMFSLVEAAMSDLDAIGELPGVARSAVDRLRKAVRAAAAEPR